MKKNQENNRFADPAETEDLEPLVEKIKLSTNRVKFVRDKEVRVTINEQKVLTIIVDFYTEHKGYGAYLNGINRLMKCLKEMLAYKVEKGHDPYTNVWYLKPSVVADEKGRVFCYIEATGEYGYVTVRDSKGVAVGKVFD